MLSRFIKIAVFSIIAVASIQTSNARYNENPKLGINVGGLGKLTTSIPFTDIFKSAKGWFTSCEYDWGAQQPIDPGCTKKTSLNSQEQDLLQLDGNGWVRSLPSPQESPIFTSVTATWKLSKHFPTGRYVILYDGEGIIKLAGDLKMGYQRPGHMEFDLNSPKRNLRLQITRTDPRRNGNYIRNIRIVPKEMEKTYQRQVFNKDYIARIRDMHALRFMPWSNIRANDAIEWNERATIGSAFYTGNMGVPAERMVDLANAINATPWLSIPYKASDDHMQKYARMVKNRLRKNQKVYVELSNEVWNSIFPNATYAAREADRIWKFPYPKIPQGKRRVLLSANWYAMRSVQMCQIFKKEFGGQRNRVKCAMGSLNTVPWVGKEILDCPLHKPANGCGRHIDAFGIGPYFGDYIAKKENRATVKSWTKEADGGKSRLFQEILNGGMLENGPVGGAMPLMRSQLAANKALADKYNLELVAYESGQHLIRFDPPHDVKDPDVLNLFMSAQKDPRMRQAYQRFLQTWEQSGGGLMLHYYGIGEPEPRNFFSMLDHLHQPSTPKYAALMEYLGTPSTYTPPRRAYVPPIANNNAQAQQQARQLQLQQQQAQRQQQLAQQQAQQRAQQQQALQAQQRAAQQRVQQQAAQTAPPTNWEQYLEPQQAQQQAAPAQRAGLSGAGIRGWAQQTSTSAISPPIVLKQGFQNKLAMIWNYTYNSRRGNEFFRLYAMDNRGGRKLLLNQPAADIGEIGSFDQIFEEDLNRYIGPPIRLILQISPGLNANIQQLKF